MKFARGFLVLALLMIVPIVSAQDASSWAGNYYVSGVDLDGVPYEAGMEVVEMDGYTQFMWNYLDGEAVEMGVGLPIAEDLMAVAYDVSCVIQVFNIDADIASISGPWAASFAGLGEESGTLNGATDDMAQYTVNGTNPDGSTYTGTLEVTSAGSDVYNLMWTLDMGSYTGIGIGGDGLVVAAADTDPATPCGVGVMARSEDGSISSIWAIEGQEGTYSDNAMPITLADRYTIEGVNTDNSTYSGSMTLSGAGSRYLVEYTMDGETQSGLALVRGNLFQLVLGGEQCAAANHGLTADGRLWTRTANLRNDTVGVAVEVPEGETNGFIGTFSMTGVAATGASAQGTLMFEAGENGLVLGSGEAARSTGETVDLTAIYANAGGVLVGVYAPGGDVTPCSVGVGMIAPDGSIAIPFVAYGGTDIARMDNATPAE